MIKIWLSTVWAISQCLETCTKRATIAKSAKLVPVTYSTVGLVDWHLSRRPPSNFSTSKDAVSNFEDFLRACCALESWRLKAPSSIECYYYLGGHHKMFAVLNLQNKDIIRITDRSAFVKSDHPVFNTETGSIELIGSTQGTLTQITYPNTRDHYRP